jgi:hypothetical protein
MGIAAALHAIDPFGDGHGPTVARGSG